jgi:hypothetical protein
MTLFTTKLAAAVFALVLLGLPIPGESGEFEAVMSGADVEDQSFVPGGKHYLYDVEEVDRVSGAGADYAQTESPVADAETVRFLEQNVVNLWDHPDLMAEYGINDGFVEPSAGYGQVDMTDLERIAGHRYLDSETIRFLENNLWDHDIIAQPEGDVDESGIGIYAIDPDAFSEEILWQDRFEDVAIFAQAEAENLFPEADDVTQLHAGVLTY